MPVHVAQWAKHHCWCLLGWRADGSCWSGFNFKSGRGFFSSIIPSLFQGQRRVIPRCL